MANRALIFLLAIIAGIFVISLSTFSVRETELAIKFRFGQIVRARLHARPAFHDAVREQRP